MYKTTRPTRGDPKRRVWVLRWLGTDGKRYCEQIGEVGKLSKRDAERQQRLKQSAFDSEQVLPDKPKRMTLEEYVIQDRESIRTDVKPTTLIEYDHATKHVYAALGRRIRLDQIGPQHVGRLKRHLQERGRRPATIHKTVRGMRSILRRAQKRGLIRGNPFSGAAKGKTQSRAKRIFKPDEVEAMLSVSPKLWWKTFIKLGVTTGLRRGEMLNLHWSDVDVEEMTIRVSRKDEGRFTVKDESFPVLPWSAKTCEGRVVPVPHDTLQLLQQLRLQSGGSRYVFLGLDRLRTIDARLKAGTFRAKAELVNNFPKNFRTIQKRAQALLAEQRQVKLEDLEWVFGTVHDLRRTYGTEMARHVPIHVLCRYLGHASMETTKDYYLDVDERDATAARDALTALYGGQTDAQLTHSRQHTSLDTSPVAKIGLGGTIETDCPRSSIG